MKSSSLFIAIVLLITASCLAFSMSPYRPYSGEITLQGHLNQNCIPHSGGTVYLHMDVDANNFPLPDRAYQPMNIAVVLDRSGSMADDHKIEHAKQAIDALVDRLTTKDYLSIVIYDDRVETLLPIRRVTDRLYIKRLVDGIFPRSATNLGGGLIEGYRQLEENFKPEYIHRVILLSDGLANRGVTDPATLEQLANRYRNQNISLSTIGVGLEYNENLMLGLADHGGGNYYFVESPSQLSAIVGHELNGLNMIVARNARIELTLGDGVTINDVIGCDRDRDADRVVIPIGDFSADEHRDVSVELRIPEGAGTCHVIAGRILFDNVSNIPPPSTKGFSVNIRYSDDAAELQKGKDWDTQAKIDLAVSTKNVEHALKELDAGNLPAAEQQFHDAVTQLSSSPAAINSVAGAGLIQAQVKKLESYRKDLKADSTDQKKFKKSVQYQNYLMKKNK